MQTAASTCPFRLPSWPTARSADPIRDLADSLWELPAGQVMDACDLANEPALAREMNALLEKIATVLLERSRA